MDSKLILEAARGTLDGTLSFPEVVGKLLAAGVEYYHVDYVGLRKRFYSAEGEMMATSINYEGLPPVAPEFDAAALRANLLDSQSNALRPGGHGVADADLSATLSRGPEMAKDFAEYQSQGQRSGAQESHCRRGATVGRGSVALADWPGNARTTGLGNGGVRKIKAH
jgi:hypothetical protein